MSEINNQSYQNIILRDVVESDLLIFFEQQLDEEANHMAAFTTEDPADKDKFMNHMTLIRKNPGVTIKAILYDQKVAGHIACFKRCDLPEVSYWIGKEYWGKGIASTALKEFLNIISIRPLYARAVYDNAASIRVLEKCGFKISNKEKTFANARSKEVEEFVLILDY